MRRRSPPALAKRLEPERVDIEEELHQAEIADDAVLQEIDHFYRKNYLGVAELTDYLKSLVFGSDEGVPTQRETEAIIEYIINARGSRSNDDSGELREYRRVFEKSYEDEWSEFQAVYSDITEAEATRSLPQIFCLPPLQKAQLRLLTMASTSKKGSGNGYVLMRIWYVDLAGCTCSTLREFLFETRADDAISITMGRLLASTKITTNKDGAEVVFVFRVKCLNEYIYGNEYLINFPYIRDCVSRQREINVVVEPMEESLLLAPLFRPSYRSQSQPNRRHTELSHRPTAPEISLWDLAENLSLTVAGGFENLQLSAERIKEENLRDADDLFIAVVVEVFFGTSRCCKSQMTKWVTRKQAVRAEQHGTAPRLLWEDGGCVTFPIELSNLPRETKCCFTVVASPSDRFAAVAGAEADGVLAIAADTSRAESGKAAFVLGNCSLHLFDYTARLRTGRIQLRMWDSRTRANPIGFNSNNPDGNACSFVVALPVYLKPVVYPSGRPPKEKEDAAKAQFAAREASMSRPLINDEIEQLRRLKGVLSTDPLADLSEDEKVIVWKFREILVSRPKAMAKLLLAVDWLQPFNVYEAHCITKRWHPLAAFDALELLGARYADSVVREHAILSLECISDYELRGCLLQLVQVLKYEPYHYSALARFLLRRSLKSSHVIGHYVFWYLVAEVKNPVTCERHGLLIEEIIKRSSLRRNYLRQVYVTRELLNSALQVQRAPKKDRVTCLRENLAQIRFPTRFTLALNPSMECTALEVSKCKVMDSKKFPLWLVFKNYLDQEDRFYVIFKSGDDLRQDLLTLQLLELMDTIWKSNGLDLHIIPYGCISTGEGVGMIEVVLSSDTVANITRREGGAQAAFSEEPLLNWLRQFNKERIEVERCLWNFVYSCAGYTVATYVLGIGDRHNDNIMLRQDGTLFHIDFGHFLGNFKTKFGIKRETAPFIFTPMYLHVMGGSNSSIYHYFVDVACAAYNVIRRYSNVLVVLFVLMLSTGIPELQTKADIEWLRSVLLISCSDEDAADHYKGLITEALYNKRTLINDYIHIVAH